MGLAGLTKIGCVLFVSRSGRKAGEDGELCPSSYLHIIMCNK